MKRITINETVKQDLIEKFTNYINSAKLSDNRINFSANIFENTLPAEIKRPTVYINSEAYLKMMLYVRDTSTEIAWHGTVERDISRNLYYIKNVFLYPQKVSGATVDTDQDKYNEWREDLDDDTYNQLRFQGHSHVNFGVIPSGTDLAYYDDILQVLPKNDYYIFMILNKSGDITLLIYDLATNIIYETQDIDMKIITEDSNDLINDITETKKELCKYPYQTTTTHISPKKMFNLDDDEYNYLMLRDVPPTSKTEDVNDIIDDINRKFKNPKLSAGKNKKIKVKGVKK